MMPAVDLNRLVQAAQAGHLVSFPTDTVPALASVPHQAEKIFAAKERQPDKPLILMAATATELWPYTLGSLQVRQVWQQMAQRYWPGALTLVLPAVSDLPAAINPLKTGTVGIRVPNHAIAQKILAYTGPLATTSANKSGADPLRTMPEIATQFPEVMTLARNETYDQGPNLEKRLENSIPTDGVPSTVVKWTQNRWEILRQGAVHLSSSALDT